MKNNKPQLENAGKTANPQPKLIKVQEDRKGLSIDFEDGASFNLPAEYLRVESPSAEVQGHGPGEKILVTGRRNVGIANIEIVGNYAIRIEFDDLHDTGIYSWRYLYLLGRAQTSNWNRYKEKVSAAGLSRDPA